MCRVERVKETHVHLVTEKETSQQIFLPNTFIVLRLDRRTFTRYPLSFILPAITLISSNF